MKGYHKKFQSKDFFESQRSYIPAETCKLLRQYSHEKSLPISRLIAIAVDNELGGHEPFRYHCDIPTDDYKEYEYASEAGLLLNFLSKIPKGIAVDTLVLARRDIGIPNAMYLLEGLRELFEKGLIETFKPQRTTFNYGRDYEKIRVIGLTPDMVKKYKFKSVEGVSNKGARIEGIPKEYKKPKFKEIKK